MAMAPSTEVDPLFRYTLKLLHSSSTDSAEKIRNALDDIIKQRHGSAKMLANTLNKKYIEEEMLAPGSGESLMRRQKTISETGRASAVKPDVAAVTAPLQAPIITPEALSIPPAASTTPLVLSMDENTDEDSLMEEDQLKEFMEFMCVVCHQMDVSVRNRLVECSECHALYHQECHKPQISEADANDQENSWSCTICRTQLPAAKAAITTPSPAVIASPSKSSHSSSSSSSSSSNHSKSSHSKSHDSSSNVKSSKSHQSSSKSSSSSHISKHHSSSGGSSTSASGTERGSSGSSNKSSITPSINIISADKRLQIMKKKAAKLHESKRKHK